MSNRPLFDDEDLPAWLKNAGITHGGEGGQAASESSASASSGSSNDDLSWLDESALSAPTPSGASPFGASPAWDSSDVPDVPVTATDSDASDWMQGLQSTSDEPAPWMQSTADNVPGEATASDEAMPWAQNAPSEAGDAPSSGFGMTGALPWRQGVSDSADQPTSSQDNLNWLGEAPATDSASNAPSDSGDLMPWQDEPEQEAAPEASNVNDLSSLNESAESSPTEEPETLDAEDLNWLSEPAVTTPPVAEELATVNTDDLGWLNEAATTEPTPASEQPPVEVPRPAIKSLKSLPSLQPKEPPAAETPATPSADAPRPAIRKLPTASQPPAPPPTPPADAPRPAIRKLPSASQPPAPPQKPAPDFSNMTYEEWEKAQAQADQEAQADPADQVMDEVPDWFNNTDAPAPAAAGKTGTGSLAGGEFMPEWFVGMEEQAPDAAPDWFSNMDLASTPLVGPESVQNLTMTPDPTPAPTSEDVPDWFKGETGELTNLDFNSMFVTEPPVEEPKSTGSLSAKLAELTPEPSPIAPSEVVEPEAEVPASPEPEVAADLPPLEIESAEPEIALPVEIEPIAQDEDQSVAEQVLPGQEETDLDWLDMPDIGDLTGSADIPAAQTVLPEEIPSDAAVEPELALPDAENMLDSWNMPQEVVIDSDAPAEPDIAPADDMPDWMQAAAPLAESNMPAEPDIAPADDMPDWMQAAAPIAESATIAEPESDLMPAKDMPDWMQAAAPVAESVASAEPEADVALADDMPDWMQAVAPMAETNAAESEADLMPAEDIPDWMQAAAPVAESATTAEPEADLGAVEDMPDWMREMQADAPLAEPTAPTPDQADVPDWMRDMAPVPPTPLADNVAVEGVQEFDWLNDFDPGAGTVAPVATEEPAEEAAATPTPAEPAPATVDIDALLSFAESATPSSAPAVEPAEPTTNETEEYDFASELEPVASSETGTATSDQLDASNLDFDALLAAATSIPKSSETAPSAESIAPAESGLPPASPAPAAPSRLRRLPKTSTSEVPIVPAPEESPNWVGAMQPSAGPVVLRIGDQEVRTEERPANILSDELQRLRERAKSFAERSTATPAVTTGPLAGITGAIDAIPEPTTLATSAGAASLIVSDLDGRRIKIIQNILGVEEAMLQERAMSEEEREAKHAATGVKPAAPARPRPKIDRFIITILLALAIGVPFFTGVVNIAAPPDTTQLSPVQSSVKDAVDAIPADQDVLVAFEYGPTGAGELDDLARVIVRDIVKRGAHPVIVSTNPAGALHAESLMASLATRSDELSLMNRTDKPLVARQDYWVLPYLPGGAIGVRSLLNAVQKNDAKQLAFSTDIEGKPSGLTDVSINMLQHNPAFVLTESQEDVRNWVEQYQAAPPNQVKLVLLSSSAASAVAQTYVNSASDQHIIGPLVGLRDAMTYQAVRQPLPAGKASTLVGQRWQSIGLATLLAALIILAGAAFNVIRGLQRRTPR